MSRCARQGIYGNPHVTGCEQNHVMSVTRVTTGRPRRSLDFPPRVRGEVRLGPDTRRACASHAWAGRGLYRAIYDRVTGGRDRLRRRRGPSLSSVRASATSMPESPSQRDPDPPPPHDPPSHSSAQLAALLAEALKDADSLRRELSAVKKRAEDLERRYHALAALSDPKSPQADTARIIHDFEQRAVDAEAARDDSESRKRLVLESWHQLDRYLQTVELRAADARAGFAKIIADGGAAPLVLASIPLPGGLVPYAYPAPGSMPPPHSRTPYPAGRPSPHGHRSSHSQSFPIALPPHPAPNANGRRPREESTDRSGFVDTLAGQPPQKKLKGFGDDRRGRDERAAYSESVSILFFSVRCSPLTLPIRISLTCINVISPFLHRP